MDPKTTALVAWPCMATACKEKENQTLPLANKRLANISISISACQTPIQSPLCGRRFGAFFLPYLPSTILILLSIDVNAQGKIFHRYLSTASSLNLDNTKTPLEHRSEDPKRTRRQRSMDSKFRDSQHKVMHIYSEVSPITFNEAYSQGRAYRTAGSSNAVRFTTEFTRE